MTKSYYARNSNVHGLPSPCHGQAGRTGDEGRASHAVGTGSRGFTNVSLGSINPVSDRFAQRGASPSSGYGGLQAWRLYHSRRVHQWNGPSSSPGPQENHLTVSRNAT